MSNKTILNVKSAPVVESAVPESEEVLLLDHEDDTEYTTLLDKYRVELDFYKSIELQFQEIYPHLLEDCDYEPADLCGEKYWADLSDHGQRLATLCLMHMAVQDNVPLFETTCPNCGGVHFSIF